MLYENFQIAKRCDVFYVQTLRKRKNLRTEYKRVNPIKPVGKGRFWIEDL
jgi:hypothetical protein